jgi:hypothetical protein
MGISLLILFWVLLNGSFVGLRLLASERSQGLPNRALEACDVLALPGLRRPARTRRLNSDAALVNIRLERAAT